MMGEITMNDRWLKIRKRAFEIIEVGNDLDRPSRVYDFTNALAIVINLAITIMQTFDGMQSQYGRPTLSIFQTTANCFWSLCPTIKLKPLKMKAMH